MTGERWYLVLGMLLLAVTLIRKLISRLPLTVTIVYLLAGLAIGPIGFRLANIDPFYHAETLERLAEVGVIVSLFTAGLKLRLPFAHPAWKVNVRLAFLSMAMTVGLITAVGVYALGLPIGAAVLLGAVLAPTDPLLASEVQLGTAADTDQVRFSATGEAGLNDGTAFPFVMLGLALLGFHEPGHLYLRWVTVDGLWAVFGGLGIGAACGWFFGTLVVYVRRQHGGALGLDEFLTIGLIAFPYGLALLAHAYGFLAVFATAVMLRVLERKHTRSAKPLNVEELAKPKQAVATAPSTAPAYLAQSLLSFSEAAERLLEVGLVLLVGLMVSRESLSIENLWFVPVLFLLIRPMAVMTGLVGCPVPFRERILLSWFGIRGIGSLYYLMYAVSHGIPEETSRRLISLTLASIVMSILVHGATVTPIMRWYERTSARVTGK